MNIFSLTGLIIVVSNSLLSLFLFVKGKRRMHNIWVVFCLTVAIWGIGVYKIGMETDYAKAIFWWRLGYFGVIFITVLYTHFIFEFLNIKKKRLLIFLYSVTIFFQILNLTDYFIKDLELVFSGFYYISNPTIFYNLFVIIFFSTVLYAIYKMIQIMKESDGYYKKQLRSFLWATYTGYIGGLFAFMPVYDIFIYPYLNILVGLFPIIIAYASLRHRMFDVAMVFQRGVIFSVLFGIISAFYIIVLVSVESVLPFEKVSSFVSGLITIIAGIYGVPVIEKYFRKLTDRIFFKDKYNYSDTLFSLSQTLNRNIDIKYMFNEIMQKLKIIFKIDKVKFIYIDNRDIKINHQTYFETISLSEELLGSIKDEYIPIMNKTEALERLEELKMEDKKRYKKNKKIFENFFQDKSAYLYVPIYLENKLIAFILLGAKKSGDSYNSEDYKLLRTFSFQAGVAIEKARLFREVRDYSEDLEQKVEERTARIKNLQEEQRLMMHEIAHGLQTPLTILKTELSDLSENKEAKEKVVSIEKSIDRVSKLIYEMLRLAKLEANNNEVKDF
ncbi:hypothetical protein C0583_05015 [Candidatus Parcubacteria bacterium]|nr:MAG: hypothetical protein C0583_05015 [Candidatus Parcubacteria bacterium]